MKNNYKNIRKVKNFYYLCMLLNRLNQQTMKLNKDSLVFEVDFDLYKKHHIDYCKERMMEYSEEDKVTNMLKDKIYFFEETGFRKLVFSGTSLKNLEHYKCPSNIQLNVLRSLPNRKDVVMISEYQCFKYIKTDTELFVTMNYRDEDYKQYDSPTYLIYLYINLVTGKVVHDNFDYKLEKKITHEDILRCVYDLFIVVITYLELTPITLMIINGGDKRGDIIRDNLIKNETKSSVIQVNSNWNVKTVRLGGFDVRGHYRLMLVGKGRTRYEYVFIRPYKKGILRRLPQKMSVESMTVEQLN